MTRLALASVLLVALSARAQPRRYQGARVLPRDVALAARSCIGELGWPYDSRLTAWRGGCAAMTGVHARRAARRGITLGAMTRAYSSPMRRGPRAWVRSLRDATEAPAGWPLGPSWQRHRPLYRRALDTVRDTLSGRLADPCRRDAPLHHGGPEGVDGDMGPGWTETDCDGTPQRFWRRAR